MNFELNGQKRTVMIRVKYHDRFEINSYDFIRKDESAASSHTKRMRAEAGKNEHVSVRNKTDTSW